jgi:hypothetical protein
LGIESIAEGVEADRQRAQLQAMGCDLLQGYLIARPMPLPDLLRWLAEPSAPGRSSGDEANARPAQPSLPSWRKTARFPRPMVAACNGREVGARSRANLPRAAATIARKRVPTALSARSQEQGPGISEALR